MLLVMNKKEKNKLIGIVGVVLLILGILSVIPFAVNSNISLLIVFGIIAVIGLVMTIYAFSD